MDKLLSPINAIRVKCAECVGRVALVRKCDQGNCPLFPYRLGHHPKRRGIGGGARNFIKKDPLGLKIEKSPKTAPRSNERIQVPIRVG